MVQTSAKMGEDPIVLRALEDLRNKKFQQLRSNSDGKKLSIDTCLRGSSYRGVSLNGKKYQVMVMGNNCKYFSGSIPYEKLAARIYDRFAF